MDNLCKKCWNIGCMNQSEEFRRKKLPICRDMIEHPEEWGEIEKENDIRGLEIIGE